MIKGIKVLSSESLGTGMSVLSSFLREVAKVDPKVIKDLHIVKDVYD